MRRATASTRSRVTGLTSGLLLIARETVIFETPISRAISARVTGMTSLCFRELNLTDIEGFLLDSSSGIVRRKTGKGNRLVAGSLSKVVSWRESTQGNHPRIPRFAESVVPWFLSVSGSQYPQR